MELICKKCRGKCQLTDVHFEYPTMHDNVTYEIYCVCEECKRTSLVVMSINPKALKLKYKHGNSGEML